MAPSLSTAPARRLAAVGLAVACFGVSPQIGLAQQDKFELPYEKFTLGNGLEVILHEDHSDPIVAVATLMHVGSNREKPGRTGFAHFFEHMSFNDSENVPVGANRKMIPEWGGSRNGGTWNDGTIYYEVVPKDAFEKIMWIDSDRFGYMINTVTTAALEREKQVVKNEKRERVDNAPYGFTEEVMRKAMYPEGHPYNWTVIGALPDLQAATLADVKEFYEEYYGAANATLAIVGDIDIAETKALVERWFGEIRRGPAVEPLGVMPVTLPQNRSLYFEDNFATLPELRLVFPSVEQDHPDEAALQVLGELLSGSKKSPLYRVVVEERALAPGVSSYQSGHEIAGEFVVRVRGNAGVDLDTVRAALEEGMRRFETAGFSDSELVRIKAESETRLYRSIETVLNKAFTLVNDNEYAGDPGFLTKRAERLAGVTRADVVRVYNQYLRGKPSVMTSFVPKGRPELALSDAVEAEVFEERIVADVAAENVGQGTEAVYDKTPSRYDRSEPAFGDVPLFRMPEVWRDTLALAGLPVVGILSDELPLVTFNVVIAGGHLLDPAGKAGTANLLADVMMAGTARRTPAELEEAIGLLGASITMYAGTEEVVLTASCLAKNFKPTAHLVGEILLEPRWDTAEFARLKQAALTNLKGGEAEARTVAQNNFFRLVYGANHVMGTPAAGTTASVENIDLADLEAFYARNLSPTVANLHVVGPVDASAVAQAFEYLWKDWAPTAVEVPDLPEPEPTGEQKVYFIDVPNAKQSVIMIGRLALAGDDPAVNRLEAANEVLGRGSSGKLTQILRIEKGYTYGAGSGLSRRRGPSPFYVSTSVRANATLPSLVIMDSLLRNYGTDFTEGDVALTRNKVLKNNTRAYESDRAKLGILNEMTKYGRSVDYLDEDQAEVQAMTLADFRETIGTYLPEDDMVYLVVGDKATQLAEVEKLGKGEVVELDIYGAEVRP